MDTGQKHADGIAAGKEIRKWDKSGAIIYTSATEEFAIHAFRINASQYLLKPLDGFLLDETLSGIVENKNFQNSKRFLIRTKEGTTAVYYHQILFVEYNCHQLFCYLVDGTVISSVYLRISFMLNVKPLLNDSRFLKISTAYVINMNYVQMVTRRGFRMINGRELSVTRTFAGAKTEYIAFIGSTFY